MPKTIKIYNGVHSLIVEKQKYIYKKYKVNLRISDIVTAILRNYVDKMEEIFSLGEYRSPKYLNIGETDTVTKTVIIPDDAHTLIVDKQRYISKKYGVNLKISDMVNAVSKNFLDKIEELFSLGEYGKIENKIL